MEAACLFKHVILEGVQTHKTSTSATPAIKALKPTTKTLPFLYKTYFTNAPL
jgi:hypothetical protein